MKACAHTSDASPAPWKNDKPILLMLEYSTGVKSISRCPSRQWAEIDLREAGAKATGNGHSVVWSTIIDDPRGKRDLHFADTAWTLFHEARARDAMVPA